LLACARFFEYGSGVSSSSTATSETHKHVLAEVGWNARLVGDEMHGDAPVLRELLVAGAPHLRVAMLGCWADHLMGLLAVRIMTPRVPTTLDLELNLYRPTPGAGRVHGRGRLVKTGRSVLTGVVEFADDAGNVFAEGSGSFMVAGDPNVRLPATISIDLPPMSATLTTPIVERIGAVQRARGQIELPRREDGLNASNTVNGGLLAIMAEEALLSLAEGRTLSSLSLRYLRPVRVGPAIATARVRDGLGIVEVRDAGSEDRLAVTASARLFDR
jgi:acyl-coenzyme A thioesterase PaaI-like protein